MVCTLFSLYSVEPYFGVIKIIIFQNILMYILSINSVIISIMSLLSSFGSILHQYFYHLIILVIVELFSTSIPFLFIIFLLFIFSDYHSLFSFHYYSYDELYSFNNQQYSLLSSISLITSFEIQYVTVIT